MVRKVVNAEAMISRMASDGRDWSAGIGHIIDDEASFASRCKPCSSLKGTKWRPPVTATKDWRAWQTVVHDLVLLISPCPSTMV